jgi:hypothetical protein
MTEIEPRQQFADAAFMQAHSKACRNSSLQVLPPPTDDLVLLQIRTRFYQPANSLCWAGVSLQAGPSALGRS